MKTIFYFSITLFFLFSIRAASQTDTMIVYDVATKTTTVIPPVTFDSTVTFEQTSYSIGSLGNQIPLSLTPPATNLFSGSLFSDIANADQFFDITKYPVRTATHVFKYLNDTLHHGCSGILIAPNVALTAAHCIKRPAGIWSGDSILIAPAFNNGIFQPGLPTSIATKYYLFKSYFDQANFLNDIALVELKYPIGDQTGWIGIAFHSDTSFYSNPVFHKLSYPGIVSPFDSTKIYNGDTLYYNYGKITNVDNNYLGIKSGYALGIPGQSGSSFLYTDNSNYYSVGTLSFANNYRHVRINNTIFYQFKNVLHNYVTNIKEKNRTDLPFIAYPNPASSSITIQTKNNRKEKYDLILTTIQGREVFSDKINLNDSYKLNVTSFANGIYFLTLQNEKERMVQKVILQH